MQNEPFIIERTFNAPIERVWNAITDKDQMKEWYFDLSEFKPVVGFEFQFYGGKEEKKYLHLCKITEVIEGKKIRYSWRYDGYEGNSFVTWELFSEGEKTRLKLTHEGLETFPASNPDLAKGNFAEGWTYIVGTGLKVYVERGLIEKTIKINANSLKVWDVLVNPIRTKQWANEFVEGATVETDWQKGSEVIWKDQNGNIGTKGIVTKHDPGSFLRVDFYDDINMSPPAPTGEYSEIYSISENSGDTILAVEAGPLSLKDIEFFSPLWDKAMAEMKQLAEGH